MTEEQERQDARHVRDPDAGGVDPVADDPAAAIDDDEDDEGAPA